MRFKSIKAVKKAIKKNPLIIEMELVKIKQDTLKKAMEKEETIIRGILQKLDRTISLNQKCLNSNKENSENLS